MTYRKDLGLLVALLLLVACGPEQAAPLAPTPEPARAPKPTPEHEGVRFPRFYLIVPGQKPILGKAGNSCWGGLCSDPYLLDEPEFPSHIDIPDQVVKVHMEGPAADSVYLGLGHAGKMYYNVANTRVKPGGDTTEWTPGVPPGNYILTVQAAWEGGDDVTFHFGVSLPEVPDSRVPPSGEVGVARPPDLILTLPDGTQHPANQGSYCWREIPLDVAVCTEADWPPDEDWITYPIRQQSGLHFTGQPAITLHSMLIDVQQDIPKSELEWTEPVLNVTITVGDDGVASWTPIGVIKGRYLLSIRAEWERSYVNYSFMLDIRNTEP